MRLKTLFIIFFITIIGSQMLSAFGFEPISTTFSPSGHRSNQIFRVSNGDENRIAVKISLVERIVDEEGSEHNEPVQGLFQIYPARLMLEPGDIRTVRVKWIGTETPDTEQAFRIIAEQIPVDFESQQRDDGGGIRLTYRYEGSLYVLPEGAEPDVILESYRRVEDDLELVFLNQGERHTLLDELVLTLIPIGDPENREPITLSGETLSGVRGENILAGNRRRFILPIKGNLSRDLLNQLINGQWEVDFAFDPLY